MKDVEKSVVNEFESYIDDFHCACTSDERIRECCEAVLELIENQQAEIERLKEEKERAIRDIDLYIADAESDAKTPQRTGKGYSVGLGYGLLIAKEILQGIRKHG